MHGFLSRDGMPPGDLLAAGRAEVTGYGGDAHRRHRQRARPVRRRRVRGPARRRPAVSPRGACSWRPACATSCPTSPACASGGRATCCTARTATATRCATSRSACSAGRPTRSATPRSSASGRDDVVLFAHDRQLTAAERAQLVARAIGIVEGAVARVVVEDDRLRGVELDDGRVVAAAALFVPPRFVPNNDLLVGLGCDLDEDGWVVTDATGRTSVAGVWVAGNVANPRAQVITAAGEGSAAAIAINADLVDEDVRDAVARLHTAPWPEPPSRPHPTVRPPGAPCPTDPIHIRADRAVAPPTQAPAGADDLAGRLPDPHRAQPGPGGLAQDAAAGRCAPSCSPPSRCRSSSTA